MNAMTSQQKTKAHRARKAAQTFSQALLSGALIAAPEDFIKAKEAELCIEHHCSSVSINASLTNLFYKLLKDYEAENGLYGVEEMLEAWKQAEQELGKQHEL